MLEMASHRRPFFLLVVVITAQVLLLAFQIRTARDPERDRGRGDRLIRLWAVEVLTPLEGVTSWVVHGFSGGWRNYVDLRHAREENDRLQREVNQFQLENRNLSSRAAEADRLATLLNFREVHPQAPMLAAQVIGSSAEASSHTIFINRGERDRMRKDMAVITPDGIVGKVVGVYPHASEVRLITDRDSGVGALFADSRTHGILHGTGDPQVKLDYIVNDEKVKPGDLVVTSGEDQVFPKDLPIGTVADTKPGNTFQTIRVRPAARLNRLEEVLVLLTKQEISLKRESASTDTQGTAAPAATNAATPAPAATSAPAATPPAGNKPSKPAPAKAAAANPSTPTPTAPNTTTAQPRKPHPAPQTNPSKSKTPSAKPPAETPPAENPSPPNNAPQPPAETPPPSKPPESNPPQE